MAAVGIIVNPWAGKDVRRLHAPVGHTPDQAKIGIVRRVTIAALEAGADAVLLARDVSRIAERAAADLAGVELIDGPGTGSSLDSQRAAAQFAERGCGAVVSLGGDGTCRDVTMGWREAPLIPISTGTNNVFPVFVDGTSAGTAGVVASGRVPLGSVARRAKVLEVEVRTGDDVVTDLALVDVAVLDAARTGARAVLRGGDLRMVVAAIASPASTGLSAIAGRVRPLRRTEPGAVVVHLGGETDRRILVPIVPGAFDEIAVGRTELLRPGGIVTLRGPGVLAYDGERDRVLPPGAEVTIRVVDAGPHVIDVDRALHCAVTQHLFDIAPATSGPTTAEDRHGD